jgi:hypothetical protein
MGIGTGMNEDSVKLLQDIERLHTTEQGAVRIRRNLALETEDPVSWCRQKILDRRAVITRKGKNWYIENGGCVITVNAGSLTIITAHRKQG